MRTIIFFAFLAVSVFGQTGEDGEVAVGCTLYGQGTCVDECNGGQATWLNNFVTCFGNLKEMPIRTDWTEDPAPHKCGAWSDTYYKCVGSLITEKSGTSAAECQTLCKETAAKYKVHDVCCHHYDYYSDKKCYVRWNAKISREGDRFDKSTICTNGIGNADLGDIKYVDTFLATGCPNTKPSFIDEWTKHTDEEVLADMYELCTKTAGGSADAVDKRECCGAQFMCNPTCEQQTSVAITTIAPTKAPTTPEPTNAPVPTEQPTYRPTNDPTTPPPTEATREPTEATSEPTQEGSKCFPIDITPGNYPEEVSWVIWGMDDDGSEPCSRERGDNYPQECCLVTNQRYGAECIDSHGDGWDGFKLVIGGKAICSGFSSGRQKSEENLVWVDLGATESSECYDVTHISGSYDQEVSWKVTTEKTSASGVTQEVVLCEQKRNDYDDWVEQGVGESRLETCCIPQGPAVQVTCTDAAHDGWDGYRLFIDDEEVCEDFNNGETKLDTFQRGAPTVYTLKHHGGACADGWIDNSSHESMQECGDSCKPKEGAGYFAYNSKTQSCSCYKESGGCETTTIHPDHNSYWTKDIRGGGRRALRSMAVPAFTYTVKTKTYCKQQNWDANQPAVITSPGNTDIDSWKLYCESQIGCGGFGFAPKWRGGKTARYISPQTANEALTKSGACARMNGWTVWVKQPSAWNGRRELQSNAGVVYDPIKEVEQVGLDRYESVGKECQSHEKTWCDTGMCCRNSDPTIYGSGDKGHFNMCNGNTGGAGRPRCTPYAPEVERDFTATWGCPMLDNERCCDYQDGRMGSRGPCIPARNIFPNGNRCESGTWALVQPGYQSKIGACPVPAAFLHPNDNGFLNFGIGACRVNFGNPAYLHGSDWYAQSMSATACEEACMKHIRCYGYNYDAGQCYLWPSGPLDRFPGEQMSPGSTSSCMVKDEKHFKWWAPYVQLQAHKQCNSHHYTLTDGQVAGKSLIDCKKMIEARGGDHFNHEYDSGTCRWVVSGNGDPSTIDSLSECSGGTSDNQGMHFYKIKWDWEYYPFKKIKRGQKCNAPTIMVGRPGRLMDCYEMIVEDMRYSNQDITTGYFQYGTTGGNEIGACEIVKSAGKECSEGYTNANYDFYQLQERKKVFNPREVCSLSAQELIDMGFTMSQVEYDTDEFGNVIFEVISETPVASVPAKVVDDDSASVEFSKTISKSVSSSTTVGVGLTAGFEYEAGFLFATAKTSLSVSVTGSHSWGSDEGWDETQTVSYTCAGIAVGFEKECIIVATQSVYRVWMSMEFTHETMPTCNTRFSRDFTSDWGVQNVVSNFQQPCQDDMICPQKLEPNCWGDWGLDFMKRWCIKSCGFCHEAHSERPLEALACEIGDEVEGQWNDGSWYKASIKSMTPTAVTIEWGDGKTPSTSAMCPGKVRKGKAAHIGNECLKLMPDYFTPCESGDAEEEAVGTTESKKSGCDVKVNGDGEHESGALVGEALCVWRQNDRSQDEKHLEEAIRCVLQGKDTNGIIETCQPPKAERHTMTQLHVDHKIGGVDEDTLLMILHSTDKTPTPVEETFTAIDKNIILGLASLGALGLLYGMATCLRGKREEYSPIP